MGSPGPCWPALHSLSWRDARLSPGVSSLRPGGARCRPGGALPADGAPWWPGSARGLRRRRAPGHRADAGAGPLRRALGCRRLRAGVCGRPAGAGAAGGGQGAAARGVARRPDPVPPGGALAGAAHPSPASPPSTTAWRGRGRLFMVQALAPGRPLAELPLPLAPSRARALLAEVLAALAAAHAEGLVHRDLKPQHVIVHGEPPSEGVTLIDFGIAKALDDPAALQTASDVYLGTPRYMAPSSSRPVAAWGPGPICMPPASCSSRCSPGGAVRGARRRWSLRTCTRAAVPAGRLPRRPRRRGGPGPRQGPRGALRGRGRDGGGPREPPAQRPRSSPRPWTPPRSRPGWRPGCPPSGPSPCSRPGSRWGRFFCF
ncbi:MAG: phosphotransferase [bacterium]